MADNPERKYADLHMHTNSSHDALAEPSEIVDMALDIGRLDVLAITDHNTIEGGLRAREYLTNHQLRDQSELQIVVGTEVTTRKGHIIGLYLEREIPKPPREMEKIESIISTIALIHEQGGLVIIPHPFLRSTGIGVEGFEAILNSNDPRVWIDGFEGYNAGTLDSGKSDYANPEASEYYQQNSDGLGAFVGASDGHGWTVGRGLTVFQGDSLRQAIASRQTSAMGISAEESRAMFMRAQELFPRMMDMDRPLYRRMRQRLAAES